MPSSAWVVVHRQQFQRTSLVMSLYTRVTLESLSFLSVFTWVSILWRGTENTRHYNYKHEHVWYRKEIEINSCDRIMLLLDSFNYKLTTKTIYYVMIDLANIDKKNIILKYKSWTINIFKINELIFIFFIKFIMKMLTLEALVQKYDRIWNRIIICFFRGELVDQSYNQLIGI